MKTTFLYRSLLLLVAVTYWTNSSAQLQVVAGGTGAYNPPSNLIANVLLGQGVILVPGSVIYDGDPAAVGYFNGAASNTGLTSGVLMTSGRAIDAIGPNNNAGVGIPNGSTAADANLTTLAGTGVNDVTKFDFDFIPLSDTLRFRFVFASEEYRDFVCSGYNDVFGFFFTGPRPASQGGGSYNNYNIATVPNTTTPITIDNINNGNPGFLASCPPPGINPQYYNDNPLSASVTNIQYNGFTKVLTAMIIVTPCQQYHVKLALADAGDDLYDSAVFLEANSFGTGVIGTTVLTAQPDGTISEGGSSAQVCFNINRPLSTAQNVPFTLFGTATPNVDYTITPNPLVIPAGATQACFTIAPLTDAVQEPTESIRIAVQTSACRRDTFDIDLIDPRITPPVFSPQAICNGANVSLNASQAYISPGPQTFTNSSSQAVIGNCATAPNCPPTIANLTVFGVAGQFNAANTNMRVCMNIAHTNDSDLDISLISPCGDVLELSTDNGGGGDNYTNSCFSVSAVTPIVGQTAPFTGTFRPEGAWSALNGCNLNGVWKLQVADDSAPTNGTLNSWSITFPPSYAITYAWSPTTAMTPTAGDTSIVTVAPTTNTTYTVTVSDSYGTSVTASASVTIVSSLPAPAFTCGTPTTSAVTFDWGSVPGAVNGYTGSYTINGGAPINVSLAAGTTTLPVSGLLTTPSTIVLTLSGSGNCPATSNTFTCISSVSCNMTLVLTAPPIACAGGNTLITATPAGNTGATTYQLGNGAIGSNNTFTVNAGTYTVTARDAASCSASSSITIANPTAVTLTTTRIDSVSCFGGSDGKAIATASGGSSPYTYTWLSGAGSANANNSLSAGTYTVQVTDANGCPSSTTGVMRQPLLFQPTAVPVDSVTCFSLCNGVGLASGTGGTAPYRALWDNATTTGTGLCVGVHTVTVTDFNGCSATASTTILAPLVLTATAVQIDSVSCFAGTDGKAQATPTGGTSPYRYVWSTGTSTLNINNNLPAGTHTVTVTDANNCSTITTVTILQPLRLQPSANATRAVSCFGRNDGQATVTAVDGTSPYRYAWDVGTGNPNNALTAGVHTVTVTDVNGCNSTATVTISQPLPFNANVAQTDSVSCFGGNDGKALVTLTNGIAPFVYQWVIGVGATPINLTATTHTVTVTDTNGCNTTTSVLILQPLELQISASQTAAVSCVGGSNGAACVTVTATTGTPPYRYLWDNAGNTACITGLIAGLHFVTVTDVNGCSKTTSVDIAQIPLLVVTASMTDSVSCNAGNDGKSLALVTGGTSPYTYTWDLGTGNPNNTLTAGTHTVSVTDANNCATSTQVVIREPLQLTVTAIQTDSVACATQSNGTATALNRVFGGTPPYRYLWDMGAINNQPTNTGLNAGLHTVTVTDASNCTATATVTILEPLALSAIPMMLQGVTCPNKTDGQASVTASNGTSPYSYLWLSNNNTAPNPINLGAGTQTVRVTDVNGCIVTTSIVITAPPALTVTAVATDSVSCFTFSDGAALATGTGGTPLAGANPYNFLWDGSISGAAPNTLNAGLHTVVVTDANSCSANTTVTILTPLQLSAVASTIDSVSCNGGFDGKTTVIATHGTSPYRYAWDNTSTLQSPTNLAAGTHTVLVTDANNCTTVATTIVYEPAVLSAQAIQTDSVSCNGGADGKAQINVSGGTQPYRFAWSGGVGTGQAPTTLPAGTHTVTVTDVNNCSTITSVTINEPQVLIVNIPTFSDVTCFGGNDGNATALVSGGTLPYHYLWSDALGQRTPTAVNLIAGVYTLGVTDNNGCNSLSGIVTIAQPNQLIVSLAVTNVACYGAFTGSIATTTIGGTPGYTYSWSDANAQISSVANSLPRGGYTVTVTDSRNCSSVVTETVTEPAQLIALTSHTDVLCNGFATATASVSPSGGVAPYTYNWGLLGTNQNINTLGAGVYVVTITDANNCTATGTAQVQEPSPIVLILNKSDVLCNGGATGVITADPLGGVPPYNYLWNNIEITQIIRNLTAGTYTCGITDANGCTASLSTTLSQPSPIDFTLSQQPVKCANGSDGTATAVAGGGLSSYSYQWSTAIQQVNPTATGLTAGTYTVTITDGFNCSVTGQIDVLAPAPINLTISATPARCYNENSGTATVAATGGTVGIAGGYSYNWLIGGQTTPNATNLGVGIYTVVVTDANGCTASTETEVTQLSAISLATTTVPVRCFGQQNGKAKVFATGGTGVYTYRWNNLPTNTISDSLAAVVAGGYAVTVTDTRGCTEVATVNVAQPDGLTLNILSMLPVSCRGGDDGGLELNVQGGVPILPQNTYIYSWSGSPNNTQSSLSGVAAGFYNCTVTDFNGCSAVINGEVAEPQEAIRASVTATESSCNAGADGTATVLAEGGTVTATAGYTYLWLTNNQQTLTATGLSAGIHTVIVTDTKSCTTSATVLVREPSAITVIFPTATNPTCRDGRDGTATAAASGATPNYTYAWNTIPAATGPQVSGLQGNRTYVVTATDVKGCTGTASVTIGNPLGLVLSLTSQAAGCFASATGTATVTANGGTPVYRYNWSDAAAQITPTATALKAGTYYVTVTDQNGCTAATNTTILQSSTLNIRSTAQGTSCSGQTDGVATVIATGGSPLYTYNWNVPNSTSPVLGNLPSGSYTVTITDANNCVFSTTIVITEPPILTIAVTPTDLRCYGTRDGRIDVVAAGGTQPYLYNYNNGSTINGRTFTGNSTLVGIQAGNYTVTVRDKNGCTADKITFIDEPQQLLVDAGSNQQVEYGAPPITLTATTSAPAGGATYNWTATPTDTSLTLPANTPAIAVSPLADTYYKIVVTDQKGCTATDNVLVAVKSVRRVFVANAITPNGDRINDILYVQGGKGAERVTYFRVYSRWGDLIFEAKDAPINDIRYGWDGTLNGQALDPAVFVWTAEVKFADGQTLVYKGDASLLR